MALLGKDGIVETVSGADVDGAFAGEALPPPNRGIDVEWVEFDPATDPADSLGRQEGRAAAEKRVEHEIAAGGTIEYRIGDERDRLYGRMKGGEVSFFPRPSEIVQA